MFRKHVIITVMGQGQHALGLQATRL